MLRPVTRTSAPLDIRPADPKPEKSRIQRLADAILQHPFFVLAIGCVVAGGAVWIASGNSSATSPVPPIPHDPSPPEPKDDPCDSRTDYEACKKSSPEKAFRWASESADDLANQPSETPNWADGIPLAQDYFRTGLELQQKKDPSKTLDETNWALRYLVLKASKLRKVGELSSEVAAVFKTAVQVEDSAKFAYDKIASCCFDAFPRNPYCDQVEEHPFVVKMRETPYSYSQFDEIYEEWKKSTNTRM